MISINFVGDIALFALFEERGIDPFMGLALPKSDYNIGNFEFIIPRENRSKQFFDVSTDYKVSYEYLKKLSLDTFNAFSLANNHSMDYGVEGAEDVMMALNDKNIRIFGFGDKNYNILTFTIKNVSFACLAFVKLGRWSKNLEQPIGPDSYNVHEILLEIKLLKKKYNHVIIYPHWGTELVDVPDPKDIVNARAFIDNGATAVIGHHPHIIQGIETYKNAIIAYSLGSFIYIPEKEIGYSKAQGKNRNYSICLNLTLDELEIKEFKIHFYDHCEIGLVPKAVENSDVNSYFKEITSVINKKGEYARKVRKQLVIREIKSFFQRLKKSPTKTIRHYFSYIKIDHFKKLIK